MRSDAPKPSRLQLRKGDIYTCCSGNQRGVSVVVVAILNRRRGARAEVMNERTKVKSRMKPEELADPAQWTLSFRGKQTNKKGLTDGK